MHGPVILYSSRAPFAPLMQTLSAAILACAVGSSGFAADPDITKTSSGVTNRDVRVTVSFTEPIQKSLVAAGQTGIISKLLVDEGSSVAAGDIIAELDHDELSQSLRIAELRASNDAKVKSALSTLRIRKQRRDAIEPMLQKGHANPAEVEEAIMDYEIAVAELEIAKQELAEAKLSVDRISAQIKARTVSAPFDGVVTELHYRLGESISTSKPQVATLVQLDRLIAKFYLTETDVLTLSEGNHVAIEIRVGSSWVRPTAKVKFVSPVTDPDSGTARVDVVIENDDQRFRSGSVCRWIESNPNALTATRD